MASFAVHKPKPLAEHQDLAQAGVARQGGQVATQPGKVRLFSDALPLSRCHAMSSLRTSPGHRRREPVRLQRVERSEVPQRCLQRTLGYFGVTTSTYFDGSMLLSSASDSTSRFSGSRTIWRSLGWAGGVLPSPNEQRTKTTHHDLRKEHGKLVGWIGRLRQEARPRATMSGSGFVGKNGMKNAALVLAQVSLFTTFTFQGSPFHTDVSAGLSAGCTLQPNCTGT